MAYGRHQSFYIKNNWINKGIKSLDIDAKIFNSVDSYKQLGIGKNMFIALRHWLEALNIIKTSADGYALTFFGEYIKNNDLACQKPLTLNLLHFFLTLNEPYNGYEKSHSFYYLFNESKKRSFSKEEIITDIINFDTTTPGRKTSEKTIAKDVDCLVQTYTKFEKSHPEDINVSILASLKLIKKNKDYFVKTAINREKLSLEFIYFLLLTLSEKKQSDFLELELLENGEMSPGSLFNMSRIDVIDVIEELISEGYQLTISRTNNLDTVSVNTTMTSHEFLHNYLSTGGTK